MRALAQTAVGTELGQGFDQEKALAKVTAVEKQLLNVGLFLAAPFIGLLYAMALPFVGMAMIAWIGAKAFIRTDGWTTAKTLALNVTLKMKGVMLFIAAPFIGLAYAVALPFLGLGMLAWVGGKALFGTPQKD